MNNTSCRARQAVPKNLSFGSQNRLLASFKIVGDRALKDALYTFFSKKKIKFTQVISISYIRLFNEILYKELFISEIEIIILKETKKSINGIEQTFNRAPKGLTLFMDGVKNAIITKESDNEFVDMMDHRHRTTQILTLASSFNLVWDLDKEENSSKRPVGLRRVTIGYAHEGMTANNETF